MDITYFLTTDENKGETNENIEALSVLAKNGDISVMEYTYLLSVMGNKSKITNIQLAVNIVNRVGDKNLIRHLVSKVPNMFTVDGEGVCSIAHSSLVGSMLSKRQPDIVFSACQIKAIKNIIKFIADPEQSLYSLHGRAGVGKTLLITEIVYYLLDNRYINSVCMSALSNKATDVLSSKFIPHLAKLVPSGSTTYFEVLNALDRHGLNIEFMTMHRLLNYKNDFDNDGNKVYVKEKRKTKDSISITDYDLIIVDECSMVSREMAKDLVTEVRNAQTNKTKIPKILMLGDFAQLLHVGESYSCVFMSKNPKVYRDMCNTLWEKMLLNMRYCTMHTVMRNKLDNVVDLCNNIRDWVTNDIEHPTPRKYIGNGVFIYKFDKVKKTDTQWFKTYIENITTTTNSNIIVTWTNRQTDAYNISARKELYKDKKVIDKYEVGDMLILSDFYNIENEGGNTRFYTSDQIRVTSVGKTTIKTGEFDPKLPDHLHQIKNYEKIEKKYQSIIGKINTHTTRTYDVWQLTVQRLTDLLIKNNIPEEYTIHIIHDDSEGKLSGEKKCADHAIKLFRTAILKEYPDMSSMLERNIIKRLWRQSNAIFDAKFCNVNYGCALTVHKSQGSTFGNVFVDADDILNNKQVDEAKRCLYTGVTRTSNFLHILI